MHFKLLLAFVNDDKTNAILKAARQAGATGATVLNKPTTRVRRLAMNMVPPFDRPVTACRPFESTSLAETLTPEGLWRQGLSDSTRFATAVEAGAAGPRTGSEAPLATR